MQVRKRGRYFMVDYRDPSGRRQRVSTGETEEAPAYAAAARIVAAAMVPPTAQPRDTAGTLGAALQNRLDLHWSRLPSGKVMGYVVTVLLRECGHYKLADVKLKTMKPLCEKWLAAGVAPATVNRRMSAVGVALEWAAQQELIPARPELPAKYPEDNVKDRYMSADEEAAVLAWLGRQGNAASALNDAEGSREWFYVLDLAVFLVDSGFRFSEAFKTKLEGNQAVLANGTTKSGDGRRVPLTTRALKAAERMFASPVHARLLAMEGKRPWEWVNHRWHRACAACGCGDVTLHTLRHTCASRLVQRGVPIYTVSKWLGHSGVKVTERYAKLAPDSLSQALAALEGKPQLVEKPTPVSEAPRATETFLAWPKSS